MIEFNKDFLWKSYVSSVPLDMSKFISCYGKVKRGGKIFFRNYHRELKNKKGFTLIDLLEFKVQDAQKKMTEYLWEDC